MSGRLHLWCAAILGIVLLRSMDAMPLDGVRLHLLGTTLIYVIMGLPFALLAEAIAGAAICMTGQEPASLYAYNFLLRGALPIAIAWCVFRILREARQPALTFVARSIAAFVAGACASLAVTGLSALTSSADGWTRLATEESVAMLMLLIGAEAQLCLIGSVALLFSGLNCSGIRPRA